jgi:Glycosyltransferase
MRILQINKYRTLNGGSESVMENITKIFMEHGDAVLNVGFDIVGQAVVSNSLSLGEAGKKASRFFWDPRLVRRVKGIVEDFEPDIIITHNIYHDYPYGELLRDLKRGGEIRIIGFLHDYKVVCPAYTLFCSGAICESCAGKKYWNCVARNCKNSILKSLIVALDSYFNESIMHASSYYDALISPSAFLKKEVKKMGFEGRVSVLGNPVRTTIAQETLTLSERDKRILFVGRVTEEKGVADFIEAAKGNPQIDFDVIGEGPLRKGMEMANWRTTNIHFLGRINQDEVFALMRRSSFLVIPSVWYENNPMVVLEAMAMGIVVVGADIGGISELLQEDRGLLYKAGDSADLANVVCAGMSMSDARYAEILRRSFAYISTMTPMQYYTDFLRCVNA